MTTRVQSVSIPVSDQDAALRFYVEVLGSELRTDVERCRRLTTVSVALRH